MDKATGKSFKVRVIGIGQVYRVWRGRLMLHMASPFGDWKLNGREREREHERERERERERECERGHLRLP
jgi:hypothetical protein